MNTRQSTIIQNHQHGFQLHFLYVSLKLTSWPVLVVALDGYFFGHLFLLLKLAIDEFQLKNSPIRCQISFRSPLRTHKLVAAACTHTLLKHFFYLWSCHYFCVSFIFVTYVGLMYALFHQWSANGTSLEHKTK